MFCLTVVGQCIRAFKWLLRLLVQCDTTKYNLITCWCTEICIFALRLRIKLSINNTINTAVKHYMSYAKAEVKSIKVKVISPNRERELSLIHI